MSSLCIFDTVPNWQTTAITCRRVYIKLSVKQAEKKCSTKLETLNSVSFFSHYIHAEILGKPLALRIIYFSESAARKDKTNMNRRGNEAELKKLSEKLPDSFLQMSSHVPKRKEKHQSCLL